ncbi:Regulator of sigma-W protease RasP [Kordia antarctica]|uniref:Regulator of sigma-W protease RasP n=1 Tax=Kordia antarctica TaxID=1218801 RepID=A0A7L4ZJ93_9FLAO|nr:M50 family metallopeptidase [Kordia antarctica]QHI36702.1 Regulator of sigma-W protease RasP [Kordia antarctica]
MILLSILFQNLGKFLCLKLLKTTLKEVRQTWNWKRFAYEFSGTIFIFLLIFISYTSYLLPQEKVYLANDDLIYGIEANVTAENIGFENGDKLVTINGEKIGKFESRSFIVDVLLSEDTYVDINRNGEEIRIEISDEQKKEVLDDRNNFISPRFPEKLTPTRENYKITEIVSNFYRLLQNAGAQVKLTIFPIRTIKSYKDVRRFPKMEIVNFTTGYFVFLNATAILIWINFLPIPGLDMGNALIAFIERKRKKPFPPKKLRKIQFIGIALLICWILISVFLL